MYRRLHGIWDTRYRHPEGGTGTGDGGTGTGSGGGTGDGTQGGWKPPATEAELKALLDQEYGKGKRHGATAAELAKQERDELAALKAERAERAKADEAAKQKAAIERGDFEKAREGIIKSAQDEIAAKYEPELQKERERVKALEGKFKRAVRTEIIAAAGSKAYNPAQVADLLEGRRVRLGSDLEIEVLDEKGEPALVGGRPMTVQQLVDSYLDANPNLIKSAGGQGGGASGGASTKGATTDEIKALEAAVEDARKAYENNRTLENMSVHRKAALALRDFKAKQKAS